MTDARPAVAGRWAWAEIDLDAIRHNVGLLRDMVAPSAVWAVVKANGYGHGAVPVAEAALDAGAEGLCVALVQEGAELRAAAVDAPILVLSEQPHEQLVELVELGLTATVYRLDTVGVLDAAVGRSGRDVGPYPVHLKVDTGMQRVGAAPSDAVDIAAAIERAPNLRLDGVFTHLACADEPSHPANAEQLDAFENVLADLAAAGFAAAICHAANSAGALAHPRARHALVRAGIAIYGISPGGGVDDLASELRPSLRLVGRVSHVKPVVAGSHVAYGWRHRFERDTTVATVPVGYADGVPRRLGTQPGEPGHDVLIGGRRCPIVGVVTMDQLVVDVGGPDGDSTVAVGDEVVLIGEQGGERIRAEDWAARLGTIGYEIVCNISARVERH